MENTDGINSSDKATKYFEAIFEVHLQNFQVPNEECDEFNHKIPDHRRSIAYAASSVTAYGHGILFVRLRDGSTYLYVSDFDQSNTQLPISLEHPEDSFGLIHDTFLAPEEIIWFRYHVANSGYFLKEEAYQNLPHESYDPDGMHDNLDAVYDTVKATIKTLARFRNDPSKRPR